MNYEKRITQLEQKIVSLEQIIEKIKPEKYPWYTLKEAETKLAISSHTIRSWILRGKLEQGKDWFYDGFKYLVNVESVKKKLTQLNIGKAKKFKK